MTQTTTLLIVEDEPVALQVLQLVLGSAGAYTVLTAGTIMSALAIAYEHRPALIISDRYLAEEDGLDLCRTVKADPVLRDTMFMLLTAASDTEHKVSGLDAGADDYLTKPYNDEELLSRVRAMLRIKALQDDLRRDKGELERLNSTLSESVQGITRLLTNIIHMRVPNALERSRRAFDLAHWMGVRLELEASTRDLLDLAAQIHEIGKISIPDEILTRPVSELTADDRETLNHFPVFGQMIVGNVPQLKLVGRMLRHQLENIDGTGLPDRLLGKEIPLTARVLRVVNVLDDLTGAVTVDAEALIEKLKGFRGTVLDPHLVALTEEFIRIVRDPEWMVGKRQIAITEIREGMTIAADICTSSGLKLLPRDLRLTATHVDRIQSHHRSDPIITGVFVYA